MDNILTDYSLYTTYKVNAPVETVHLLTRHKSDSMDADEDDAETELRNRFPLATWIEPFTWGGLRYMNTPLQLEDME